MVGFSFSFIFFPFSIGRRLIACVLFVICGIIREGKQSEYKRKRKDNEMLIVTKPLSEIRPYEKNPRKNDEAVQYVANSIKEFGFKVPIVIDKDGIIVAGHTRYKASKKLKLTEVPCIIADDLTEEQIKAYRLADNKVAEKSEWDFDLLSGELDDILNIDMEQFDFDVSENIEEPEVVEDDFVEELPEEPKAKLGDIYQLGNHRLMCGDSTSIDDVSKLMNGNKADMVFTDPPYKLETNGGCKGEVGKALKKQGDNGAKDI